MNVEYFPYDEQSCFMKFGSWTYNGAQVDLKHLDQVGVIKKMWLNLYLMTQNFLGSWLKPCSNWN